jgi:hypothetical protein
MKRLEDFDTSVVEDVANDAELKQKLLQAKKDIQDKNYYTSAQLRELIKQEKI